MKKLKEETRMGIFDFLGFTEGARCRNAKKRHEEKEVRDAKESAERERERRELMEQIRIWQKKAEDLLRSHPGEYFTGKRMADELGATGLQRYFYTLPGYVNPYDRKDAKAEKELRGYKIFFLEGDRSVLPLEFDRRVDGKDTYYYYKKR